MNNDTLYTRGEFLKVAFAAIAVFFAGGLLANSGRVSRLLRRGGTNAYGNSMYGGKA